MIRKSAVLSALLVACAGFLAAAAPTANLSAQGNEQSADNGTPGQRLKAGPGIPESTVAIMQRQRIAPAHGPRPEHEVQYPDRSHLPQNPAAPATSHWPAVNSVEAIGSPLTNIHTTSGAFNGATLTDTGAFPPDSMGTVGPTQFIVFSNGRIRSFTKAGAADGVLNADPDVFFASVMTPVAGTVVLNFTSDPQIRYDRFSGRWFMSIIDVPCTNGTCTATAANRWLLAVSNAASNGTISGATVWTFFQFQADPGTNFCDYPSLGIDVNALYVGCNMFTSAGSFVGTNGYVVQKSSTLGTGPMVVTAFPNLALGTGAGPYTPRGVDNFDASATQGYFVGVDNATFSTIMFRRVTNPGSVTPTISANISLAVPTTTFPNTVEHLGNTGGTNGNLDSLDDRLFQAMIRNGHLWTAHNIRVNAAGTGSTVAAARNAARWYEFQNLSTTPTLLQSGTVYDNPATRAAARQYWIPSIAATGQDHAVIAFSMAGSPVGATPAYTGRLSGDTLGAMAGVPGTGVVTFGTTTANYNPPSDPGGGSGRRWGDYSFTVVDPLDDMSVWTIQEYNQASNSYAVRVGHLLAPPPATPTCPGTPISFPGGTGDVVIAATSTSGSGFYDPGSDLPAPALAFNHLSATVTNATVNSATYNSPTQVTLNITANTGGLQDVTITNPDGQSVVANGCINVSTSHTVTPSSDANGAINPNTPQIVVDGATPAFTLTPNASYHIANVTGSCGGGLVGNVFTTNPVTTDCTVMANFAIDTFTLTYTAGTNGTIVGTTPQIVNAGADGAAVTAQPDSGYSFVQWSDASTANPRTDTNVLADVTVSASFAANPATQLVFTTQPVDGTAGIALGTVTVEIQDALGNPVVGDNNSVTLSIGGPGPFDPASTVTVNAVDGVATFSNLILDTAGTGYTLTADDTADVLTSSPSDAFAIAPGAPLLVFTTEPTNVGQGTTLGTVVVTEQDSFGNVIDDNSNVDFTIAACGGPVAIGSVVMVNGVATLNSSAVFYTLATHTIGATNTNNLATGTSASFDVIANGDFVFADGFEGCHL